MPPGPERVLRRVGRSPEAPALSVNEAALAHAILYGKAGSVIDYTIDAGGNRRIQGLRAGEWPALTERFRQDPKDAIGTARLNLFAISKDPNLPENERAARIERYVRAYLDLQIKLDTAAFPDVDQPQRGVPAYIPEGLIDMGSDSRTDPAVRGREMLRVNKKEIFRQNLR